LPERGELSGLAPLLLCNTSLPVVQATARTCIGRVHSPTWE